jgi:hypothetical protein
LQDGLEQMPKGVTFPESPMPVPGEGRMIRHLAFKTQAAEPALGQVEVDFLARSPLGADAVAVTHDQHA